MKAITREQLHKATEDLMTNKLNELYDKYKSKAEQVNEEIHTPMIQDLEMDIQEHIKAISSLIRRLEGLHIMKPQTDCCVEDSINNVLKNFRTSTNLFKICNTYESLKYAIHDIKEEQEEFVHPSIMDLRKQYCAEIRAVNRQFLEIYKFIEANDPVVAYTYLVQAGVLPDNGNIDINPKKPEIDLAKILPA